MNIRNISLYYAQNSSDSLTAFYKMCSPAKKSSSYSRPRLILYLYAYMMIFLTSK
jgi:hypothetical protein